MAAITQTISPVSPLAPPPDPRVPSTFDAIAYTFSTSLKTTGDQISEVLVGELNTFKDQANSLRDEVNISRDQAIAAKNASENQASIATAKAELVNAALLAVEAALDVFDDRYLGSKTSDPVLDNDGNPLAMGALYYYTNPDPLLNKLKIYDSALAVWTAVGFVPTAHTGLSGLEADDHPQYLTQQRLNAAIQSKLFFYGGF